jgi:hypothetical protein
MSFEAQLSQLPEPAERKSPQPRQKSAFPPALIQAL